MIPQEIWIPIEGFENYKVSSHGRIMNSSFEKILNQRPNNRGQLQVTLYLDGRPYTRMVSRLVARAYLPTPHSSRWSVFHVDEDLTNNRVENLEWRPRWFLHKHAIQRKRSYLLSERKVRLVDTGEVFDNSLAAAKHIGGLEVEVLYAAFDPSGVRHLGYTFEFVES